MNEGNRHGFTLLHAAVEHGKDKIGKNIVLAGAKEKNALMELIDNILRESNYGIYLIQPEQIMPVTDLLTWNFHEGYNFLLTRLTSKQLNVFSS